MYIVLSTESFFNCYCTVDMLCHDQTHSHSNCLWLDGCVCCCYFIMMVYLCSFVHSFIQIDLSDDEEDLHPNIDKESWFRMKHRSRVEREDHEAKDRKRINEEV
jgi:hypothetical protein